MNLNNEELEKIIKSNEGLIHNVINKYFSTYKYDLIIDDMEQIGRIALFKCAKNFDETRGVKFSTFATRSIINNISAFIKMDFKKYIDVNTVSLSTSINEDKTLEDVVGLYEDYSNLQSSEMLNYIKSKDQRTYEIALLLNEGYTYQAIGDKLGISKQRVGILINNLRKDLERKFKLSFKEPKKDGELIAFNENGFEMKFKNSNEASKILGIREYTIRNILKTRNSKSRSTCKNLNDNVKVGFKWA